MLLMWAKKFEVSVKGKKNSTPLCNIFQLRTNRVAIYRTPTLYMFRHSLKVLI